VTGPGGQERRKFPRVHKRVMLRFQCVAPELLRDKALQVGIIMDISKGGLVLRSPRTYLPGAIIELHMPNTEVGPARLFYMRVVWQRRTESVTQFDIAGAFVRYTVSAEPVKKKTGRAAGETRRFEAATLGPPTGQTVRRVASSGEGSDRRKHARWQERIYLKYRCVSKGPFNEYEDRVGLMLDFSRGGFVFAGLRDYPVGSVMEVKFPQTPLGAPRTIHARVVRTRGHEKPGQHQVACAFVAEKT